MSFSAHTCSLRRLRSSFPSRSGLPLVAKKPSTNPHARSLRFEPLEERQLLASSLTFTALNGVLAFQCDATAAATVTVSQPSAGSLQFADTGGGTINLTGLPGWSGSGTGTVSGALPSGTKTINILGAAGQVDRITLEACALPALSIDNNVGTTNIDGDITTNDSTDSSQDYESAVVLKSDATLTSTGNKDITFNGTVHGDGGTNSNLVVNTGGKTVFAGNVGAAGTDLTSLTTGGGGETDIGGNINTVDKQTYNDDVVLTANVTLASDGQDNITFNGLVDNDSVGLRTLTVNTYGVTTFAKAVGSQYKLGSLTTDGAPGLGMALENTTIEGDVNAITQQYNDKCQSRRNWGPVSRD